MSENTKTYTIFEEEIRTSTAARLLKPSPKAVLLDVVATVKKLAHVGLFPEEELGWVRFGISDLTTRMTRNTFYSALDEVEAKGFIQRWRRAQGCQTLIRWCEEWRAYEPTAEELAWTETDKEQKARKVVEFEISEVERMQDEAAAAEVAHSLATISEREFSPAPCLRAEKVSQNLVQSPPEVSQNLSLTITNPITKPITIASTPTEVSSKMGMDAAHEEKPKTNPSPPKITGPNLRRRIRDLTKRSKKRGILKSKEHAQSVVDEITLALGGLPGKSGGRVRQCLRKFGLPATLDACEGLIRDTPAVNARFQRLDCRCLRAERDRTEMQRQQVETLATEKVQLECYARAGVSAITLDTLQWTVFGWTFPGAPRYFAKEETETAVLDAAHRAGENAPSIARRLDAQRERAMA